MSPQAQLFLDKADDLLAQAEIMLRVELLDACGRNAYLAAFHAAQAFIFERERKVLKTHGGVRSEFSRLTRDDARFDGDMRGFLYRAYNLKSVADYEVGATAHVTLDVAAKAIEDARRFVACISDAIIRPDVGPDIRS